MAELEKSSDEILQELFGMCAVKKMIKAEPSSPKKSENSSDDSDNGNDSSKSYSHHKKHKHEKKRKKSKKEKKRKRSFSASGSESEDESSKTKKRKSRRENESSDINVKKEVVKIKMEKGAVELSKNSVDRELEDGKNSNLIDLITGERLTIGDVFTTLGILTDDNKPIKIKREKLDPKYGDIVKIEKLESLDDVEVKSHLVNTNIVDSASKENAGASNAKKDQMAEAFDSVENNGENSKSTSRKINIKNLKNSSVYEATIKEVEKRAQEKAEKYEEGELSESTDESNNDSWNDDRHSDRKNETKDDASKKESKSHKHKKKSKIRDSSEKIRSYSHSKKHKEKKSHRERDRYTRGSSIDVHKNKLSNTIDTHSRHRTSSRHHHSQEHDRHHRTVRSSSLRHRSSSLSKRSHQHSRSDKDGRSASKDQNRDRSTSIERIDKQKLLEIARKNAITLLKQGAIPASVIAHKDKIVSIRAGGKTVDELTDFCKKISRKETEDLSTSDDSEAEIDEEREKAFHHPFQIKERPSSIVMNIKNAVPLPTKTAQEKTLELSKQLSLQYPVSSGQQHRKTEGEWVPFVRSNETAIVPSNAPAVEAIASIDPTVHVMYPAQTIRANATNAIMPPLPQPTMTPSNSILPHQNNLDISNIVAQRLEAIRRLSENPKDPIGNNLIQTIDSKMQVWAESKIQPGFFTGSTGVRTLSAAELAAGCRASFPKKNQFHVAKPVYSDKGEALMKKMGWQPGEGLGKFKQGPSAPCEISVKMDRKGLAEQTVTKNFKQANALLKAFEITQNKHPVSLLNEYCSRKKLPIPIYECQEMEGASRRKLFLFSVMVNGIKYMPQAPSMNKKQSKIEAATICLQNLGLLPIASHDQSSS